MKNPWKTRLLTGALSLTMAVSMTPSIAFASTTGEDSAIVSSTEVTDPTENTEDMPEAAQVNTVSDENTETVNEATENEAAENEAVAEQPAVVEPATEADENNEAQTAVAPEVKVESSVKAEQAPVAEDPAATEANAVAELFKALPAAATITAETSAEEKAAIMTQATAAMDAYAMLPAASSIYFDDHYSELMTAALALNDALTGNEAAIMAVDGASYTVSYASSAYTVTPSAESTGAVAGDVTCTPNGSTLQISSTSTNADIVLDATVPTDVTVEPGANINTITFGKIGQNVTLSGAKAHLYTAVTADAKIKVTGVHTILAGTVDLVPGSGTGTADNWKIAAGATFKLHSTIASPSASVITQVVAGDNDQTISYDEIPVVSGGTITTYTTVNNHTPAMTICDRDFTNITAGSMFENDWLAGGQADTVSKGNDDIIGAKAGTLNITGSVQDVYASATDNKDVKVNVNGSVLRNAWAGNLSSAANQAIVNVTGDVYQACLYKSGFQAGQKGTVKATGKIDRIYAGGGGSNNHGTITAVTGEHSIGLQSGYNRYPGGVLTYDDTNKLTAIQVNGNGTVYLNEESVTDVDYKITMTGSDTLYTNGLNITSDIDMNGGTFYTRTSGTAAGVNDGNITGNVSIGNGVVDVGTGTISGTVTFKSDGVRPTDGRDPVDNKDVTTLNNMPRVISAGGTLDSVVFNKNAAGYINGAATIGTIDIADGAYAAFKDISLSGTSATNKVTSLGTGTTIHLVTTKATTLDAASLINTTADGQSRSFLLGANATIVGNNVIANGATVSEKFYAGATYSNAITLGETSNFTLSGGSETALVTVPAGTNFDAKDGTVTLNYVQTAAAAAVPIKMNNGTTTMTVTGEAGKLISVSGSSTVDEAKATTAPNTTMTVDSKTYKNTSTADPMTIKVAVTTGLDDTITSGATILKDTKSLYVNDDFLVTNKTGADIEIKRSETGTSFDLPQDKEIDINGIPVIATGATTSEIVVDAESASIVLPTSSHTVKIGTKTYKGGEITVKVDKDGNIKATGDEGATFYVEGKGYTILADDTEIAVDSQDRLNVQKGSVKTPASTPIYTTIGEADYNISTTGGYGIIMNVPSDGGRPYATSSGPQNFGIVGSAGMVVIAGAKADEKYDLVDPLLVGDAKSLYIPESVGGSTKLPGAGGTGSIEVKVDPDSGTGNVWVDKNVDPTKTDIGTVKVPAGKPVTIGTVEVTAPATPANTTYTIDKDGNIVVDVPAGETLTVGGKTYPNQGEGSAKFIIDPNGNVTLVTTGETELEPGEGIIVSPAGGTPTAITDPTGSGKNIKVVTGKPDADQSIVTVPADGQVTIGTAPNAETITNPGTDPMEIVIDKEGKPILTGGKAELDPNEEISVVTGTGEGAVTTKITNPNPEAKLIVDVTGEKPVVTVPAGESVTVGDAPNEKTITNPGTDPMLITIGEEGEPILTGGKAELDPNEEISVVTGTGEGVVTTKITNPDPEAKLIVDVTGEKSVVTVPGGGNVTVGEAPNALTVTNPDPENPTKITIGEGGELILTGGKAELDPDEEISVVTGTGEGAVTTKITNPDPETKLIVDVTGKKPVVTVPGGGNVTVGEAPNALTVTNPDPKNPTKVAIGEKGEPELINGKLNIDPGENIDLVTGGITTPIKNPNPITNPVDPSKIITVSVDELTGKGVVDVPAGAKVTIGTTEITGGTPNGNQIVITDKGIEVNLEDGQTIVIGGQTYTGGPANLKIDPETGAVVKTDFILDHLTVDGVVITENNAKTYQAILDAQEAWNALTDDEKAAVNKVLTTKYKGQTYEELLKTAIASKSNGEKFVKENLTKSGKIITKATKDNFEQILAAKTAWDKLSETEKAAANAKLVANGGKTYEELYADAQSMDKAGASWIKKHLTYNNKTIKKATADNYATILAAETSWNKLSATEKAVINAKLKADGGKTFEELLKGAKAQKKAADKAAVKAAATSWIKENLTYNNATITAATNDNYQTILNAEAAWNELTADQQAAVNDELTANGGKTFEELLKDAKAIKDTLTKLAPKTADTARTSGFMAMILAIGCAGILYIRRRKNVK